MEVNFFGTVALTKAFTPQILSQQIGGHFGVVTSLVGNLGNSNFRSSYAASKHHFHGFFETLRSEQLKDQIHVTLFAWIYSYHVVRNAWLPMALHSMKWIQAQANGMSNWKSGEKNHKQKKKKKK